MDVIDSMSIDEFSIFGEVSNGSNDSLLISAFDDIRKSRKGFSYFHSLFLRLLHHFSLSRSLFISCPLDVIIS